MGAVTRALHYRGDATDAVGSVVGPNLLGEMLTIVAADYEPEHDRTTATLRYGIIRLDDQEPPR